MNVHRRVALAFLAIGLSSDGGISASAMMMDYTPLTCNTVVAPSIESTDCLNSASAFSSLVSSHGGMMSPLTIPCGSCVVVDQTDGATVTLPHGLNVLGRLHFPPSANVVLNTTAVFVQGILSAEEPNAGNLVKFTLYGKDDVTFYPHEECCSGVDMNHRDLEGGLRSKGGSGRGLMENGCDMECAHKKNVSLKPIVVAGGKLDLRAVNPYCPSWTKLTDVKSIEPPPIAAGCNADGSILKGDGSFESGVIPNGLTSTASLAIRSETANDGSANKYLKVAGRPADEHGIWIDMGASCAIPGRRYRFTARHRLDNGATNDEFLGQISYKKTGGDWVHKHFMLCKNRVSAPNEWSSDCHDDFLIDENVAGAVEIKVSYFPTNQVANVDLSFDNVHMDLVYDPLVVGLKTDTAFASCLDVGDEVMVSSSTVGDDAWKSHQTFTVGSVDASTGTFNFDGEQMYQSFPTLNGPGEPIYALEVARLNRRFVFEAQNDSADPLHGGHFIVMHTPNIPQTIMGLEIRGFGQQGKLGRYPLHFHMSGDVTGTVVSKNVVRDSHQRCYVLHGTDNVMVEDNVALNATGHCYILEDGGETGNTFKENLAAMVAFQPNERSIGASDHDATAFWVTNVHNNYIGNVAAGGSGAGFWFETLGAVVGPSADLPKNDGVIPMYMSLDNFVFKDNWAHSSREGIRTYFPGWKPEQTSVLDGLVLYKNHNTGIFLHANRNIVVKNSHFADNGSCATHALHNAAPGNFIEDSVCVGMSQDVYERFGEVCRKGISYTFNEPPYAQVTLRNITFHGWDKMYCGEQALLTVPPDRDPRYAHATLHATDLVFDSENSKPDIKCSLVTETGDKDLFLEDVDGTQGSMTGVPGFIVQDEEDMLAFLPNCVPVTRPDSCAVFCENVCLRRAHISTDVIPGEDLKLAISDGTTTHLYGRHPFTGNFEPVLPAGTYEAHFENANGHQVFPGGLGLAFNSAPLCTDHINGSSITIADNSNTAANLAQIPEAMSGDYQLVYELGIPSNPKYQLDQGPVYSKDNHADISSFSRVAYYLELDDLYVWVSMDAFTTDVRKIGVPCISLECGDGISPTVIQQVVANVNVVSNVPGLSGSGYVGNIEFWPFNYGPGNAIGIPGALDTTYDFGDAPQTDGNYGSMQVHVHGGGSHVGTIFAFNRFNDGAVADLGIGNNPTGQPDWALASNANSFNVRKLQVYVDGVMAPTPVTPSPITSPTPVTPSPITSPTPVTPSPIMAPTPVTPSPITSPTPVTPSPITSPTPVTPSPTMSPTGAPVPSPTPGTLAVPNIPDSEGYELVYNLDIPSQPNYELTAPLYSVDNSLTTPGFLRIAYYLTLGSQYVWVSMDKFTNDARKIGVPCKALACGDGVSATVIQQVVTNVNVVSNVAGLSGSGYEGNIEFWPFNFSPGNAINIPGASSATFDFGDTADTAGSYGSMQVHVHGSGSHTGTVFAFNRFNDGAVADLGIGNFAGGQPDWALAGNANTYSVRNLRVFVSNTPITPPTPPPIDPYLSAKNIPDAEGFQLVYALDIPTNPNYSTAKPDYSVDNSLAISSFSRVAYYMELNDYWVWVSMDKPTSDARQLGVPCLNLACGNGAFPTLMQKVVTNVNVASSIGMLNFSGRTGNIEFWPYNYFTNNALGILDASSTTYDFGDQCDSPNGSYGSMQVHVHGGSGYTGTIFAFNFFNGGSVADLGISNKPSGNPDWTLSFNANVWNNRKLRVYVAH